MIQRNLSGVIYSTSFAGCSFVTRNCCTKWVPSKPGQIHSENKAFYPTGYIICMKNWGVWTSAFLTSSVKWMVLFNKSTLWYPFANFLPGTSEIICSPPPQGWSRVNWSVKNWECQWHPRFCCPCGRWIAILLYSRAYQSSPNSKENNQIAHYNSNLTPYLDVTIPPIYAMWPTPVVHSVKACYSQNHHLCIFPRKLRGSDIVTQKIP